MNNQPSFLYRFILGIYFILTAAFLLKIGYQLATPPIVTTTTSIPNIDVDKLEQVVNKLEGRTNVPPAPQINLNEFEFGKTEPFN